MAKSIVVDTNCWLRYSLKDHPLYFEHTKAMLEFVDKGIYRVSVPAIVLLEVYFHLIKSYQNSPEKVRQYIKYIISLRNLNIINCTDFLIAYDWHQDYHIKLADCLIVSKIPSNSLIVTWDREFKKIPELKSRVFTPTELLKL